jgi:hypothetical protein
MQKLSTKRSAARKLGQIMIQGWPAAMMKGENMAPIVPIVSVSYMAAPAF